MIEQALTFRNRIFFLLFVPAIFLTGLGCATPLPKAPAQGGEIMILRPLNSDKTVFQWFAKDILEVPGGRYILFQVEVSAFSPLLEIRINGEKEDFKKSTWVLVKKNVAIKSGQNGITVFARTKTQRITEKFTITLLPPSPIRKKVIP